MAERSSPERPAGEGRGTGRPAGLSIGDAARQAGVSTRALRYYEEMGLLAPAGHSPGGHRLYGEEELARVRRIRELQELMGFNLSEICDLLGNEDRLDSLRDAFHRVDDPEGKAGLAAEAIGLLRDLRARVAAKQERLDAFARSLAERQARAEAAAAEFQADAGTGADPLPNGGRNRR